MHQELKDAEDADLENLDQKQKKVEESNPILLNRHI
jgi:hypothetical protein